MHILTHTGIYYNIAKSLKFHVRDWHIVYSYNNIIDICGYNII